MTRRGPDEGSIYERWDGRWAGSVHIGYEDGRRVRKHVMGRTRSEVTDKMAALMRAHEEKRPIPNQREKVGPFLRRWLDEVAKPTLRASTYDSYDDILRLHLIPGLGQIPLAKLTPAEVQAFLNRKLASGLSPRRVQYIHAVLRRALVTAERWGMVTRNVAKLVDPPRVPEARDHARSRPSRRSGSSTRPKDDRYRALYVTALGTGLRQGELLGLRWEDVDLEVRRLRVRHTLANVGGTLTLLEPKTDRSRRTVMLPDSVVTALRAHRTRQKMERLVAGLTLGRQRPRVHDDHRHAAPRGDRDAGVPGRPRAGRPPRLPVPRPPSCRGDLPARAGHDPRGRQAAPRPQLDHADLEHLRARARAAPAAGGAGDGRGAGRIATSGLGRAG